MRQTTHTTGHQTAKPPADAGPYAYGLPVTRDGAQVAPLSQPASQDGGGWGLWSCALFALMIAAEVVERWAWWPPLHTYAGVYCLLSIMSYWVTPKPRGGFVRWTLKMVGLWLNLFVGLVTVPQSLRALIPDEVAFGLPAFLVILACYWLPQFRRNGVKTPLWQRLAWAAGFALFWAHLGPTLVK